MKTIAILALGILASCAGNKAVIAPRAVIVPKATPAVSLAPVQASSARIGVAADAIGKESESAGKSVLAARKSAEEAKRLTDVKNKALLETIDQLLGQLSDAENAVVRLNGQVEMLKKANAELTEEANKAAEASQRSEDEKTGLRQSLAQANQTIGEDGKTIKDLQDKNGKAEKAAASAGVYKHWVIGLVAGFVGWTILKNILMIYLPTTRFRI